ncbi:MAG: GAF domain-containing protein [Vitreoscilla sp.]
MITTAAAAMREAGPELRETDRGSSFCSHAIRGPSAMVVEDALADDRFRDNPLVPGDPQIRFYAGAPLMLASGHALGTLCVIDRQPRTFTQDDCTQLANMAALVMAQVDLHHLSGRLDSVTRLPNRAQMTEDLDALCSDFPGERRCLMLLDVMGHAQLQAAVRALGVRPLEGTLRQIAAKRRSLLPSDTALYHVSETRFSFLLPQAVSMDADAFVSALMNKVREPFTSGGISVELDAQAGLVDFVLEPAEAADAIRRATSAMHESMSQGKTSLWYGACFDAEHRRAYSLLRDVPGGLQRGEFRLVYQPKLNLRTRNYSGVEALAR